MPEWEDTGQADIALMGDPDPERGLSQREFQSEARRQANQFRLDGDRQGPPGPQEDGGGEGGEQEPGSPPSGPSEPKQSDHLTHGTPVLGGLQDIGDAAGDITSALQRGYGADYQTANQVSESNPLLKVLWDDPYLKPAWLQFGMARRMYNAYYHAFLDGNAISQSVQDIYHQDTAQAQIARFLINPGAEATAKLMGRDTAQQRALHGQQSGQVLSTALPLGADPMNAILPELKGLPLAQKIALMGGPGTVSALTDPTQDPTSGLVWAAIAGAVFSGGPFHVLGKFLPKHAVEDIGNRVIQHAAARRTISGLGDVRQDWISDELKGGVFPALEASQTRIAKAAKQSEGPRILTSLGGKELRPGELAIRPSEEARQITRDRQRALKVLGLGSLDDLTARAQAHRFTPRQAEFIRDNWKRLGLPYDLYYNTPEEGPLRDPRMPLGEIHNAGNELLKSQATKHLGDLHHMLAQIHSGIFNTEADPLTSLWRSLIGQNRATDHIAQRWLVSMHDLVKDSGVVERDLRRAAEGDHELYGKLPPEARMAVDSFKLVRTALRKQASDTGYRENFVAHWFPRTLADLGTSAAKGVAPGARVFTRTSLAHRALGIGVDEEGKLIGHQAFPTTEASNQAVRASREQLAQRLAGAESLKGALAKDPEVQHIRSLADPEERMAAAQHFAGQAYQDFDEGFFRPLSKRIGNEMRAVHTQQAMNHMQDIVIKDASGALVNAAVRKARDSRLFDRQKAQGLVAVNAPHMEGYLFHPEWAKLVQQAQRGTGHEETALQRLRDRAVQKVGGKEALAGKLVGQIPADPLELERKAVGMIMYSPMIHGLNMAGNFAWFAGTHNPVTLFHYLKTGKALLPHQVDEVSNELRYEAYRAGMVPPNRFSHGASEFMRSLGDALGDSSVGAEFDHLDLSDASQSIKQGGASLGTKLGKVNPIAKYHQVNDAFWKQINDFGVMVFHIEKEAMMHAGVPEEEAMLHAANRANSWMGHVRPEDTNPILHNLARTAFFAPNWWRTFVQLLVPVYKNSGYGNLKSWSPEMRKYIAFNEAKTVMAMFGVQKLTGNAANFAFSGHFQDQNQAGNQDKVEITRPEIIRWLQARGLYTDVDPNTGMNKNGARITLENPLARRQQALELATGMESGYEGTRVGPQLKGQGVDLQASLPGAPQDVEAGLERFGIARASPFVGMLGALANVDLYRSVKDQQWRSVNPDQLPLRSDLLNAALAPLYLTPLGSSVAQGIQGAERERQKQGAASPRAEDTTPGPFGTHVPRWTQDMLKGMAGEAGASIFSGLTGVNPPYETAQKTRGTPPSDEQYQMLDEENQKYQQDMTQKSVEAMSGQMPPADWLKWYRQRSQKHRDLTGSVYHDAPEYVNGPAGMAAAYEKLYDKPGVRNSDGSINHAQLQHYQQEYRSHLSKSQQDALDAELAKNDQKYPMLKLYHKTMDGYDKWQEDWAAQNGVDVATIRKESGEYGKLYGNNQASNAYLAQHPELRRYENAKKAWEKTPTGVMYGLFYGSSSAQQYLTQHHETVQQAEEAALAAS